MNYLIPPKMSVISKLALSRLLTLSCYFFHSLRHLSHEHLLIMDTGKKTLFIYIFVQIDKPIRFALITICPLVARFKLASRPCTLIQNETVSFRKSKIQNCSESKITLITFVKGVLGLQKLGIF